MPKQFIARQLKNKKWEIFIDIGEGHDIIKSGLVLKDEREVERLLRIPMKLEHFIDKKKKK